MFTIWTHYRNRFGNYKRREHILFENKEAQGIVIIDEWFNIIMVVNHISIFIPWMLDYALNDKYYPRLTRYQN